MKNGGVIIRKFPSTFQLYHCRQTSAEMIDHLNILPIIFAKYDNNTCHHEYSQQIYELSRN